MSGMSRLDKRNLEDRVASLIMRALVAEYGTIGERVANVRFTDKGCTIDLADGRTVAVRVTACNAKRT